MQVIHIKKEKCEIALVTIGVILNHYFRAVRRTSFYDLEKKIFMSLFNKIFKTSANSEPEKEFHWQELKTEEQLESITEQSHVKPQLIFKHSTRCGISRMVKTQFERNYEVDPQDAGVHYLDLIAFRDVSNSIANKFDVIHESPQLIILKNGKVQKHESHGAINDLPLKQIIEKQVS